MGRIRDILAARKTLRVRLAEPMPVLLIYLTAMVDDQGQVHYRKDVYKRDAAVVDALDRSAAPVTAGASQSAG